MDALGSCVLNNLASMKPGWTFEAFSAFPRVGADNESSRSHPITLTGPELAIIYVYGTIPLILALNANIYFKFNYDAFGALSLDAGVNPSSVSIAFRPTKLEFDSISGATNSGIWLICLIFGTP